MEEEGRLERNDEVKRRRVGVVYDERMCNHHTPDGDDHYECPDRIRVIWNKLQSSGLIDRCVVLKAKKAEDKYVQSVHTKSHVDLIHNISSKPFSSHRNKISSKLDSIYLNEGSSEAAYLAAGSVLEAAELVAKGELHSAFAIVRPPGHHAEENEPMGFCLFNNVAVATSYLLNERQDLGIQKILIVDWDVHHGNATQKMFWKDSRVLCFSVHRHDFGSFYPGTDDGFYDKIGEGPGEGYNINFPWEQGSCGDPDYLAAWDNILIPVAKEYNPDMVIISAGFDAAVDDPLGGCCVSPYGYSVMLSKLMDFSQGKVVLALEGGYNLQSLENCAHACVQVLLDKKPITGSSETHPKESTWRVIENVRRKLSVYWPCLSGRLPKILASQKALDQKVLNDATEDMSQQRLVSGLEQQVKSLSEQVESLKKERENEKERAENEKRKAAVVPGLEEQIKNLTKELAMKKQRIETLQDQAKEEEDALRLRDSAIRQRDAAIAARDAALQGTRAAESALNAIIKQKDEALNSLRSALYQKSLELMFCEAILRPLKSSVKEQAALGKWMKSLRLQEQVAGLADKKYTFEEMMSSFLRNWDRTNRIMRHMYPDLDMRKLEQVVIDGAWRHPVEDEVDGHSS